MTGIRTMSRKYWECADPRGHRFRITRRRGTRVRLRCNRCLAWETWEKER